MTARTITLNGLTDALEHISIHTGERSRHVDKATYPGALAHDVFRHVEDHREPLYENGAVYIDAYDVMFLYDGWLKKWHVFGSSVVREFATPKRPLRKLVPETVATTSLSFNII